MADGQWDLATLEIEKRKTINDIERNTIQQEKIKLDKRDIQLKVSEMDTKIDELQLKIDSLNKSILWFNTRIEVKTKEQGEVKSQI